MEWILRAVESYGLFAVFVLILLEYACFPLPSEVVLPLSGAIASQNEWTFGGVLAWSVLAGVLGSLLCYGIGYLGGYPLVEAVKRRFPKTRPGLEAAQEKYDRYATLSVGVGRLIPLCRTYISFVAGMSRQHLLRYLLSTAAGVTAWNFVLVGLGYLFAENWDAVSVYYDQYKMLLIPLFLLTVGFLAARRVKSRRRKQA